MPLSANLQEIVTGYANGYFLMDNGEGLGWYSSRQHALVPLDGRFHMPRSLRSTLDAGTFTIRINEDFEGVIEGCRTGGNIPRDGEWISDELSDVYRALRRARIAHSFETWTLDNLGVERLAGGILGLTIGGAFIGESMFHHVTDASKVALVKLVQHLRWKKFMLFDAQVQNPHLARFGTYEVPEREYKRLLAEAVKLEVRLE